MRLLVGIAIERDGLRAVGVRGGRVLWGVDASVSSEALLVDSFRALLAKLPISRWSRPRVTVALGPAFAQMKRLAGLPSIDDERLLARAVSEHAARFFLKNGVPLVTTSLRRDTHGQVWGAALHKNVIDMVVSACRTRHLRLSGIVPAVDVTKGDAAALVPLGHEARQFAAAYGAAITTEALMWRAVARDDHAAPPWRIATIASATALTFVVAVLSPGISARVAERQATAHLASIAAQRRTAQRVWRDNQLVTEALGEAAAFDQGRRSMTTILAAFARALPDSAALLAFHTDSAGGSIVVLAPRASTLLTRLENVRALAAPEIVGPVTREAGRGYALERVTVRFRWNGS